MSEEVPLPKNDASDNVDQRKANNKVKPKSLMKQITELNCAQCNTPRGEHSKKKAIRCMYQADYRLYQTMQRAETAERILGSILHSVPLEFKKFIGEKEVKKEEFPALHKLIEIERSIREETEKKKVETGTQREPIFCKECNKSYMDPCSIHVIQNS